jgi:hypothetical protein
METEVLDIPSRGDTIRILGTSRPLVLARMQCWHPMATTTFTPASLLRSADRGRWRALICCLLTLFATYDSYLFATCAPVGSLTASPNNSPFQDDDDDDEMLDTPRMTTRTQALLREASLPWSASASWIASPGRCLELSCKRTPLPKGPRCEHQQRNGIGAPLLC